MENKKDRHDKNLSEENTSVSFYKFGRKDERNCLFKYILSL